MTLEHYLAHTALLTNADAMDDAQDKVRLMTVHAAKGLEFAHVFLCSMTEGVLPSRKTDTPQGMEEERRLAFVAMTRARDGLYLTEAEGRGHEGAPRYPSRFLLDIDPAALEFSNKPAERELDDARAAYALADRWIADLVRDARFAVGDRVTHAAFGSGRVLAVDSQKRAYEVAFDLRCLVEGLLLHPSPESCSAVRIVRLVPSSVSLQPFALLQDVSRETFVRS